MTNLTHATGLAIGHPAPQRHQARPALLLFVLFAAPAGWLGQLLYAFAATSSVCAGVDPGAAPVWLTVTIIALNVAALAVALAAFIVALGLLRRTAHEHRQRSGGVLEAAEGRTRFLAIWGVAISMVFFVATLVNSFSLSLVSICGT